MNSLYLAKCLLKCFPCHTQTSLKSGGIALEMFSPARCLRCCLFYTAPCYVWWWGTRCFCFFFFFYRDAFQSRRSIFFVSSTMYSAPLTCLCFLVLQVGIIKKKKKCISHIFTALRVFTKIQRGYKMKTCSRRFWYSSHSDSHICSMSGKLGGLCRWEPNLKAISLNIFLVAFRFWHRLGHSVGNFQCWLVVATVTDLDAGSHQQFAFSSFLDPSTSSSFRKWCHHRCSSWKRAYMDYEISSLFSRFGVLRENWSLCFIWHQNILLQESFICPTLPTAATIDWGISINKYTLKASRSIWYTGHWKLE